MELYQKQGQRKGEAALDWWSFIHLGAGLALGLLRIDWLWAVVLVVGFEGLEAILRLVKPRRMHGKGLFEHESWPNIVADVIIGLGGFALVHHTVGPLVPWPWEL